MPIWEPKVKSADCLKKLEKPVLTKDDIPYEATLIFNAGVEKVKGKYVMAFRNDYGTDNNRPNRARGQAFLRRFFFVGL